MPVRLTLLVLMLGLAKLTPAAEPERSPIGPRMVSVERAGTLSEAAADIAKQSGFHVTVEPGLGLKMIVARPGKTPFWNALEDLAKQADGRIALHEGGRRMSLEPRRHARESSSIFGPFRTVSRQVVSRFDLDSGEITYVVQIESQWEPRFPVFRISSAPQIAKAVDDRGTVLTASSAKAFAQPTGSLQTLEPVRLGGLTRDARSIAGLSGFYTVTASEKMLAFRFNDLTGKFPASAPPQSEVTAKLRNIVKDESVWEIEIELTYPAGQPKFESFEESVWLSHNQMQIIPPGGGKAFSPDDHQILEAGQRVVAVYRFKESAANGLNDPRMKGWSIVYETPAPLLEFNVPFELKDIPLP